VSELRCFPDLSQYVRDWAPSVEVLRQNRLLDEADFIGFARDRGIQVWGVVTGDPGDFNRRSWLTRDGTGPDGSPLFHPFRIYPLHQILQASDLHITPSASIRRDRVTGLLERVLANLPSIDQIGQASRERNRLVDLSILLEPVYWPQITGRSGRPTGIAQGGYEALLDQYRHKIADLIRTLDPARWREGHQALCLDAASLDPNSDLYLLLRMANWSQREGLRGRVSGSLWLRHIAEVIRRAFEEAHGEQWLEEDQVSGIWFPGGRKTLFGSERPLDDELHSRPYLAWNYGLLTGSVVRWYVEGETEYHAILHVLSEPPKVGIELVNLRGNVAAGRDNAALKLRDWLLEDKAHRRFSIISFDYDVGENIKAIRRQVVQRNIVGLVAAHRPDFEFANFTIEELTDVAATVDEKHGIAGDPVRNADWTGVKSGRAFEEKYKEVSARRPRALKGEEWGRALAAYALEHPTRSDNMIERPYWKQIQAALRARIVHYDLQKARFGFDPDTFESIKLEQSGTQGGTGDESAGPSSA
jgi:hypothetical protein